VYSIIFLILLVASAPVVYYMRRNVYFAVGWFLALAIFGFLIPPAEAHVECLPVANSTAVQCVEKPVEDPLAPAVKVISLALFILSLAAAAVALLFDAGRLISRWLR
jgi:hypothetical protein